MQITAEAYGPNARAIIDTINAFSEKEWGIKAEVVEHQSEGKERDGTLLAIIAILLALPGSILATMQLLEKAKFKNRLAEMLATVRNLIQPPDDKATLRIGEYKTFDLATVTPEELIEALAEEDKPSETDQKDV